MGSFSMWNVFWKRKTNCLSLLSTDYVTARAGIIEDGHPVDRPEWRLGRCCGCRLTLTNLAGEDARHFGACIEVVESLVKAGPVGAHNRAVALWDAIQQRVFLPLVVGPDVHLDLSLQAHRRLM